MPSRVQQPLSESSVTTSVAQYVLSNPLTCLSYLLAAVVVFRIARAILDPLRAIPGPFLARFSRTWLFAAYKSGRYHLTSQELHQKYGPVVRVAPGQYSVNDAEATKTIFSYNRRFLKSKWYKPFNFKGGSLFTTRDPVYHAELRRKFLGVYSMSALVAYAPYVKECIRLYLRHLDGLDGRQIDIMHWNQCFAFDVVALITFSHRLGFLDRGHDEMDYITSIAKSSRITMLLGIYPFLFPWIHIILGLFFSRPRAVAAIAGYVQDQTDSVLRRIQTEKLENTDGKLDAEVDGAPVDFISKLLRMEEDKENRKGIKKMEVMMAATQNIVAGSDSTGISMTSSLYHLIKHPLAMSKLREELSEAYSSAQLDSEGNMPYETLLGLPYLQAVIKEAMRVHPANAVPMPREVPADGATVCGHYFPPGSVLMVHAWVSHKNEDIWGPDAGEFNPDRWLEPGRVPPDVQFLTWGQGTRICAGRNIALLEMTMLLPRLIMRYDFELVSGRHEKMLEARASLLARPDHVFVNVRSRA